MRSDTSEPRLRVERKLDQASGEADVNYYWDGALARKVRITGPLADRLSGLTLIVKDLRNAHTWIKLAKQLAESKGGPLGPGHFRAEDRELFDTVRAHFVAALTFYGKCFTEAEGRHANASRDWIDPKFRDTHDYYMKYRHNFAAHSGDEHLELAQTFVLVQPDGKALVPHLPTARLQPDIVFSSPGEVDFADLIDHVANVAAEKYQELARKLIDEFIIPKGVEFWKKAAEDGEAVNLRPAKKSGK